MKRTLSLTLLFMFSLTTSLTGCASHSKVSKTQTSEQVSAGLRAPASASTPTAWGKPVSEEAAEFLDEIENAKAQSY